MKKPYSPNNQKDGLLEVGDECIALTREEWDAAYAEVNNQPMSWTLDELVHAGQVGAVTGWVQNQNIILLSFDENPALAYPRSAYQKNNS